jgi:hypothetical protein
LNYFHVAVFHANNYQVISTRQPVSGATIWYGHRRFNEIDQPVGRMEQFSISGENPTGSDGTKIANALSIAFPILLWR